MKRYAKIENEKTKVCSVGIGTNEAFYRSIGMTEMEVEQAYDGQWYLKGYAPEKPIEQKKIEVRAVRNQYLTDTDKYMIVDYPITDEQREEYKAYRQYLRDYTKTDSWYEKVPITFEEFEAIKEHASAKEVTEQIVTDEVDNGTV